MSNCTCCPHVSHEGRKCSVQVVENPDPTLFYNGLCNCDGKTQRFYVSAPSQAEVEQMAGKISTAGYSIEEWPDGSIATQLVDAKGERMECWALMALSDSLPYVASLQEFKERVGFVAAQ